MIYALAATLVVSLALIGLIAHRFRAADQHLDSLIRATELILQEGHAERERQEEQVSNLLNRIQAPDAAPFVEIAGDFGKQHVSIDSDDEYWESREELNGRREG